MRGTTRGVLAIGWCVLLAAAGCATTGGVEVAGPARQVSPPPTTTPAGPANSADGVALLRADPHVNTKVKALLAPCETGQYPVDERYADLTGDRKAELVLTVFVCPVKTAPFPVGNAVAGYVFDLATDPPTRLLSVEEAGVEMVPYVASGDVLAVLHKRYLAGDDPCCPTDQRIARYRWNGHNLVEARK
jgi:hypothetical protein